MAAFGIGATLSALGVGVLDRRLKRTTFLLMGVLKVGATPTTEVFCFHIHWFEFPFFVKL